MDPAITILIPVRNGEDFLAEAIESVIAQTYPDWTMLIRDNCSEDGTRRVAARYLSDPRIRLIVGDSSLSMAGNFNRCLNEVRTKYYMVLCHDDYLCSPHAIAAAHDVMEANECLPTVYCDLIYVDRARPPIATRHFGYSGFTNCAVLARSSILRMRNSFGIPALARTAALGQLRYDETLPYVIDLDLSIATAKGGQVYHIPEVLIANRYHTKNHRGVLLGGVCRQMRALAQRHGIPLSPSDRVM